MEVQALRWWSDQQLDVLAPRFRLAMARWCEAWGLAAPEAVVCRRAHEWTAAVQGDWHRLSGHPDQLLCHASAPRSQLHAALFDEDGGGDAGAPCVTDTPAATLAGRLTQQAWQELCAALCTACGLSAPMAGDDGADRVVAPSEAPWSGAVIVDFAGSIPAIALRIAPERAAQLIEAQGTSSPMPCAGLPARQGLESAMRAMRLQLHVELAPVQIDVASLQALSVGDVIRLPHLLDRPLSVHAGNRALPCSAYLGQRHGRRAVGLMRAGANDLFHEQEPS